MFVELGDPIIFTCKHDFVGSGEHLSLSNSHRFTECACECILIIVSGSGRVKNGGGWHHLAVSLKERNCDC